MTAAILVAFLLGLCAGAAFWWTRLRALRAQVKLYQTYIHERLDNQVQEQRQALKRTPAEEHPHENLPSAKTGT